MNSKSINVILLNGDIEGAQKYRISGETTIGYKMPRECIKKDYTDDFYKELNQSGVYVLIGKRERGRGEEIYVGQTDNVARRLYDHKGGVFGEKNCGKIFWTRCLAFVESDNQMEKGHTEYLEEQFYSRIYDAGRYSLVNSNRPRLKTISEEDKIFCEGFIEDCVLFSEFMGVPIFSKKEVEISETISELCEINNSDRFLTSDDKYIQAKGHYYTSSENDDGFLVLEGSIIANEETKKAPTSIKKYRRDLKKSGIIKDIDGKLRFTQEYIFDSPGIAASVVMGRSASAKEWK